MRGAGFFTLIIYFPAQNLLSLLIIKLPDIFTLIKKAIWIDKRDTSGEKVQVRFLKRNVEFENSQEKL